MDPLRMTKTLFLISVTLLSLVYIVSPEGSKDKIGEGCFCKLQGEIDDCSCSIESVDSFNNLKVYPRLNSLLSRDYFRYWRANLQKECPFWVDDSRCALKDCHVNGCTEEELPNGLRQNGSKSKNKYTAEAQEEASCDDEKLGDLDRTISKESREAFRDWLEHDDAQENFCELDDESSNGMSYVDLTLNPERYTGYKGKSPHRIWSSIYEENCFTAEKREYTYLVQRRVDILEIRHALKPKDKKINKRLNMQENVAVKNKEALEGVGSKVKWRRDMRGIKHHSERSEGQGTQNS